VNDKNRTKKQLIEELEALRDRVAELTCSQEEMQQELEKVREYIDSAGIILGVIDTEYRIVFVNRKSSEILGYEAEDMIGKPIFDAFIPEEDRNRVRRTITRLLKGDTTSPTYHDIPILTKSGERRMIAWHLTALRNEAGEVTGVLSSGKDFTQKDKDQQQLEESRELLRNLTEHLQSTREAEKIRISREIHDDLGHTLAILRMDLSWLKKRLPQDEPTLLDKVDSISGSVALAIQKVKAISAGLRPGLLDDLGLAAAIEWQADEVQNLSGIKCKFTSNPTEIILDRDRSTVIFRSFQQLLSNVVAHARATQVEVRLTQTSDSVSLEVRDNGIGIRQEQIHNPKSFGIIGIQERLYFLGGELEICGTYGKGTKARVTIPLTKRRYYEP